MDATDDRHRPVHHPLDERGVMLPIAARHGPSYSPTLGAPRRKPGRSSTFREAHSEQPIANVLGDERGVVLPTAMFVLIILTSLSVAFATLGASEPRLGRNHLATAQARSYAESAVERAIWAINNNQVTYSGSYGTAPYDGSQFLAATTLGGFKVTVNQGASTNERNVLAAGFTPIDSSFRGMRKIQATVMQMRWNTAIPPSAVNVMGNLQVGGNAHIEGASTQTGVSYCAGGNPVGGSMTTGTTTTSGDGKIYGPGNETANESPDIQQSQPTSAFNSAKLTAEEFAILRTMAKAAGTYYTGSVNFSSTMPNGIIFVDTTTGADLTSSTPSSEKAAVYISGTLNWSGWLVVAGGIQVSGTVGLTGMLYAQDDFTFTGNGTISGAVLSENRQNLIATVVDSSTSGSSTIRYNCQNAQNGGGTISLSWFLKPGTFVELDGR